MVRIEKAIEELVNSADLPSGCRFHLAAYWDAALTCQISTAGYGDWFGKSQTSMQGIKKKALLESLFSA